MSRAATANMFDILSEDGPKQPAPAKAAEASKDAAAKPAASGNAGQKGVVGAQKPARETQNRESNTKSDAPARSNNRILQPAVSKSRSRVFLYFFQPCFSVAGPVGLSAICAGFL